MKPRLTAMILFSFFSLSLFAQQQSDRTQTPSFVLKSNLLYDITATMNLGAEFKIANKWTLELPVSYNPWTFSDNRKWKHILVQPEARWWTCEPFNGHFFGIHAHYAYFNAGNVHWGALKDYRYEGWAVGAGLSYGYQLYLSRRFNLEFSLGLGYAYLKYDKYECKSCGNLLKNGHKNYFGPTKAAISLVYFLK